MKHYLQIKTADLLINSFFIILLTGMTAATFTACSSSISAGDDGDPINETRTYDLMLSVDGSTKVGTATTERITPESDAYIDEGFFITLEISEASFEAPFDIFMNGGQCGTWGVEPGDKAEMPCDYDEFMPDPADLTVVSEDGDGPAAYPVE